MNDIASVDAEASPDRLNVADRFDSAAAWAALDAAQKQAIGTVALDLVAGWSLQDDGFNVENNAVGNALVRIGEKIDFASIRALQDAVVDAVPRATLIAEDGQTRIPVSLGMVCRACGCSEEDACSGGCSWAKPNLCSECAPISERARP